MAEEGLVEKESTTQQEKIFFSELQDADHKLRRKFGDLLSDWEPSQENILFLQDEDYKKQLESWSAAEGSQETSWGYCFHPESKIAFNLTNLLKDPQYFKTLATHEMIHVHTLKAEIPIEIEKLPQLFQNAPKEWSEGVSVFGNSALETIVTYLAVRTLKLLGKKPIDNQKPAVLTEVFNSVCVQEILEPAEDTADKELLGLLKGKQPQRLITKLHAAYNLDAYHRFLIPILASIYLSETRSFTHETRSAWAKIAQDILVAAVARKGRARYVLRNDFKRLQKKIVDKLQSQN